jgi:drug/metabolite transporter (DMT)-like permease
VNSRTFIEIFLLAAVWGASFPIIRTIVPEFGPVALTFLRCAIGGAALAAFLLWRGQALEYSVNRRWYWSIGLIGNALPFLLFAFAARTLPASYPSVINAMVPLFGALLAVFMLAERMTLRRAAGIGCGLAGVAVLVGAGPVPVSPQVILAALAGLAACFGFALSQIMTKRHASHINAGALTAGMMLVSCIALVPFMPWAWPAKPPGAAAWLLMIVLAVSNSAFATTRYMALVVRIGPVKAMTVPFLIPVFGVLWSALFLRETITLPFAFGSALVLGATWLVAREKR